MSETKAALIERPIRLLENLLYRYMEANDTSTFTNWLIRLQNWIVDEIAR